MCLKVDFTVVELGDGTRNWGYVEAQVITKTPHHLQVLKCVKVVLSQSCFCLGVKLSVVCFLIYYMLSSCVALGSQHQWHNLIFFTWMMNNVTRHHTQPMISKHRNMSHPQTQFETRWWEKGTPNGGARSAELRLGAGWSEVRVFCGTTGPIGLRWRFGWPCVSLDR